MAIQYIQKFPDTAHFPPDLSRASSIGVAGGNLYVGGVVALAPTIPYAQLSSAVNQQPGVTTPVQVVFATSDLLSNMTVAAGGNITISETGIYLFIAGAQVGKTGGGGQNVGIDMWMQNNGADLSNSNVRNSVTEVADTKVVVLNYIVSLTAGDVVKIMMSVSNTSMGAGLLVTNPVGEARIPSIIVSIVRVH